MEQRQFCTIPRKVAIIGQGTWKIDTDDYDCDSAIAALSQGLELGMTRRY
ncbi:hypothetical protein [Dulcicalothrix desertica]|nr:hypothetical protein [Dulcicalothrix desertica]TWH51434.1 hypothetical protein CAL7102_05849 [Dulcicalothrix desertica PCC 7102]